MVREIYDYYERFDLLDGRVIKSLKRNYVFTNSDDAVLDWDAAPDRSAHGAS